MKLNEFAKPLTLSAVVLSLTFPTALGQQDSTTEWNAGMAGNWSDPTWSMGDPTTGSLAGILNGDTVTVADDAADDLEQILIEGGSVLNIDALIGVLGSDAIDNEDPVPDVLATGLWTRDGTINVGTAGTLLVGEAGEFRIGQDAAGVLSLTGDGYIETDVPMVWGAGGNGSASVTMTGGEILHEVGNVKLAGWGADCTWDLSGGTTTFNTMRFGFGNAGGTGTINHSAGTLSLTGENNTIGWASFDGSSITYNLSGTGVLEVANDRLRIGVAGKDSHSNSLVQTGGSLTVAGRIDIGESNAATTGTSVYDMSGGTAVVNSWMFVGAYGATGTGTLNVSGDADLKSAGMLVGNGMSGTANVSGGMVLLTDRLRIGSNNGSTGTNEFNLTGGDVEVRNRVDIGQNPTQTNVLNVSGGTLTMTGEDRRMLVGFFDDGTGIFNLSGTGIVDAEQVVLGDNAGTTVIGTKGTVNLTGGTLIANRIRKGGGEAAEQTLNLNGGTIEVREDAVSLIEDSLTNVNLLAGGITFDTVGFDASTAAVMTGPGGLTKTGAGTLTVNSVQAYSGDTTVEEGTLVVKEPYLADDADVLLAAGATLDLSHVTPATDTIGRLVIDGVPVEIGEWGPEESGAANETPALSGAGFLNVTQTGSVDVVDPRIISITVAGDSATIVMEGTPSTDYVCKSSFDLIDFTEITPTSGSTTTDSSGDATFAVDANEAAKFYLVEDQP